MKNEGGMRQINMAHMRKIMKKNNFNNDLDAIEKITKRNFNDITVTKTLAL